MKNQIKDSFLLCAAFLAASTLFTGCGNEESAPVSADSVNADGRVALKVHSGILTRAAGKQWSEGDAVGIYMVNTGTRTVAEEASNREYTAGEAGENVAFQPDGDNNIIYYPVDAADKVDFLLYYPYRTLTDHAYSIDVSRQSDLPAIDLMSAKVTGKDKAEPGIAPVFSHLLTRLKLEISAGEGLVDTDLEGLTVKITRQRTLGSYNVLAETMTVAEGQDDGMDVTLNTVADGTASEAILLPTTAAGGINPLIDGRQLVFTLNNAKRETFVWPITPADKQFEAGKKNIYKIEINRTETGLTASIADWGEGNGNGDEGSAE